MRVVAESAGIARWAPVRANPTADRSRAEEGRGGGGGIRWLGARPGRTLRTIGFGPMRVVAEGGVIRPLGARPGEPYGGSESGR